MSSLTISAFACVLISLGFVLNDVELPGLFYVICLASGILILRDGIDYLRGRMGSFDPVGIIGLVGVMMFFVSPVLQRSWNYWPFLPDLSQADDWMILWATLNLLGILIYRTIVHAPFSRATVAQTGYTFNRRRFKIVIALALAFSLLMQLYVYSKFGGIAGFIATFTERQSEGLVDAAEDPFEGMGLPMLFAESFKLLIAMGVIYLIKGKPWAARNSTLVILMAIFGVVFLFFGGLRGSRSSTIFALFFAAGMYSLWIKPIRIKFIVIGALVASAFLTTYYWYKIAGTDGMLAMFDSSYRANFNSARQDASKYIVARDMGRMDVQVLALKQYYEKDYDFSYGRTYLTAIFAAIPKSIVPYKPDQITKEKTEIIYGRGSYIPDSPRQTTLVLGQFGEFFINFGLIGVFAFWIVLGLVVRRLRMWSYQWQDWDVRRFILPVLTLIPILMLITDMNVLLLNMTRYLFFPVFVALLCIRKRKPVPVLNNGAHHLAVA
ncbi:hypothetical protein EC845_3582 [Comamonas sp. BIGb0124]|uniref:hypothetical protein n=1 Tax=Comamonas sp. BIGb0124 TaxID=2485130 RepID=UPI000F482D6C|nr:hypothetical protein [Comamonas sp. BIGb0124]ROR18606.1 hypothetical protein EC845_3582 [Comamonas sp. BIGb0124]